MSDTQSPIKELFVSYSRKDATFVKQLITGLEKHGLDPWFDVDGIPKGQDWWDEIKRGIVGTNVFVFIISPDSMTSKVCNWELHHAITHGKRIIPIQYKDVFDDTVTLKAIVSLETDDQDGVPVKAADNWAHITKINFIKATLDGGLVDEIVEMVRTDYDYLQAHTRLNVRAVEWQHHDRDSGYLLRGADLESADRWVLEYRDKEPALSALQTEYILASRQHRETVAQRWRDLYFRAMARLLGSQAQALVDPSPDLSLLIAAEAVAIGDIPESRAALLYCLHHHQLLRCYLHDHNWDIGGLAFTPDNQHLVSFDIGLRATRDLDKTHDPAQVIRWSLADFEPQVQYQQKVIDVMAVCDDEYAIGVENTILIYAFDNEDPRLLIDGHEAWVSALAFSPSSQWLASADTGGHVNVWDKATGKHRLHFHQGQHAIQWLVWMDENRIGFAGEDKVRAIRLDPPEWLVNAEYDLPVHGLVAGPGADDLCFMTLDEDWQFLAAMVNIVSGDSRAIQVDVHGGQNHALAYSPQNERLFTAGGGGNLPGVNVAAWQLPIGQHLGHLLGGLTHSIRHLAVSPNGRYLAAGGTERTVIVWDLQAPSPIPMTALEGEFTALDVSHHIAAYVVGLADGTVRCEGLATTAIKLHNAPVQHVRLMANDQKLLIIYADHTLVLWDVVNGQEIAMTTVPCDPEKAILSVAFSDQLIATSGADGRTHIFDANDLSLQAKLEAESTTKPMVGSDDQRYWQPITAMAFTPDGSHLLCGLQMDSYLLNRDLATGTLITEDNSFVDMLGVYVGDATDPGGIQSIVYSPDQFHLLIASGYAVCIVDADTLELKERRSRHHEDVQHITVSPDGIYFVTAARSEILYWAMDQPEPLGTIPLTKSLKEMKFSADGQQLYGLSQRGQVLVWEMSPDAWTNQARSKANRELTDNERNRYLDRETDTDYFPD